MYKSMIPNKYVSNIIDKLLNYQIIVYCLLPIILLNSCKTTYKSESKASSNKVSKITSAEKLQVTALLIDGKKEAIQGNYDNAVSMYYKCIAKDPNNAAAKYEIAEIYIMQRNFKNAISLLKEAAATDPDNIWYNLQLAKAYEQSKQYTESIKIYNNLYDKKPDHIDLLYNIAGNYIMSGNFNEAIKTFNKIETKIGVKEELSTGKKDLYLRLNKLDKAIAEIQKLIDNNPKETKYYLLIADIYLANKQDDEAFKIYQKILSLDPDNANVHLSLANYYRIKGDDDKSFEEIKIVFSIKNIDIYIKIQILTSYYMLSQNNNILKEQAYTLLDLLIQSHPNDFRGYSMYADYLNRDNRTQEAKEKYKKVITLDSTYYAGWEQLLIVEMHLKEFKELANDSKKAIELFPLQPFPYLLLGQALESLKRFDEAVKPLEKGAEITVDNNDMLTDFYSILGDVYNELKNYHASDDAYDKALLLKKENEYVLNNYAYYLSVRGEKLEKAESMAKQAVDINPKSPTFLDTYGWVLYKSGKLTKAKEAIEKALDYGGKEDDVILEHYGDILYKSGNIERAVEYWKNAKDKGKGTEFLDKKINEEKLYE